jgi:hypothetical protein
VIVRTLHECRNDGWKWILEVYWNMSAVLPPRSSEIMRLMRVENPGAPMLVKLGRRQLVDG